MDDVKRAVNVAAAEIKALRRKLPTGTARG
jgi:hypothetical protein